MSVSTTVRSLLCSLVAAAVLGGCDRPGGAAKAPPAPKPPLVTVSQPLKRLVADETELVGRFIAVDTVEVKARVSGYLEAVQFRDGEIVQKGAPLFVIDRRPFEIARDQALATLAQAEANLALAESDLARARDLSLGATISKQTMDQRTAAKRAAEAGVLAQRAAVRQAELDLEFTELKAPITGRIGDRRVSPGNLVASSTSANSSMLATIQSLDPIRFEFTLDESAYLRLRRTAAFGSVGGVGLPVALRLIDEQTFAHKGAIDFLDNALSRTSATIRGRAQLPNDKNLFAPGMFARARVTLGPPVEALLVPDAAIGSEQVRKTVFVVGDDNVVKQKYVELGELVDGLRVITAGLDAADRVVIDGLLRARPGATVEPKSGTIAASAPSIPENGSRSSN